MNGFKSIEGVMVVKIDVRPIIESRSFQVAIANFKTQWSNQMQLRARCGAGSGNIAGIWRDLRVN
jgi:hypothetical protein